MKIPAQHGEAVRHAASALAATGEQPGAEITTAAADLLDHTARILRGDAEAPSRDALDLLLAANEVVTGRRPDLHRDHLAGALRDLRQAAEPRMQ